MSGDAAVLRVALVHAETQAFLDVTIVVGDACFQLVQLSASWARRLPSSRFLPNSRSSAVL